MGGFGRATITTNPVTDKLRSGQPSVGSWLTLCSPVAAESMALGRVGLAGGGCRTQPGWL